VRRVLIYLGALCVVPLLVGASVSMTSWLVGASLGLLGQPHWVSVSVLRLVPYGFTCVAFTLVYKLLPNCPVQWRHAIAGGLIAAVAFELAKLGFAWYIANFPTYTMIYGAFAVIPIFLLWVYISWVVVVIGATITAVLPDFDPAAPAAYAGADSGKIGVPGALMTGKARPREPAMNSAPAATAHSIDRRERLIVALDVPTVAEAKALAESLGDSVRFYKIGLELFTSGGYFELLDWLAKRDKKVFADLKFYDIPETVRRAVGNLKGRGATFVTVHGHRSVMQAAVSAQSGVKILAVTVLTSFDKSDLAEMGATGDVAQLVLSRARNALDCGCDGVISSGLEAPQIKSAFGERLLIVTPGIRPSGDKPSDDQKRTVDVAQAFANGADYIVVGRPIREAKVPRAAAEAVQATIAGIFPA
jgi:orotidine-5'-phosphate decarboxylase